MILAALAGGCLGWALTARKKLWPTPSRRWWAEYLSSYRARAKGVMQEREFIILTAL